MRKSGKKALQTIEDNSAIVVFPIWVQRGEYDKKDGIENQTDVHVIEDFSSIGKLLEDNADSFQDKKIGAIIDLDGVISNDEKRKELQVDALIKSFREKGWL